MTKFNDAEITWENSHEKARSDTADMGEARDNLIDLYITADDVWDAVCALNYDAEVDEKAREICAARLIKKGLLKA